MNRNSKNEHITFKTLRSMVRSTIGKNKPTPKYLRENEEPVAVSADGSMAVYPSGFVTYKSVTGSTVVNLAECGSYTYTFDGGKMVCRRSIPFLRKRWSKWNGAWSWRSGAKSGPRRTI